MEWCYRALGLEPGSILFVDDREVNIRAAEATGMRGHLFTTPTQMKKTHWMPLRCDGRRGTPRSVRADARHG